MMRREDVKDREDSDFRIINIRILIPFTLTKNQKIMIALEVIVPSILALLSVFSVFILPKDILTGLMVSICAITVILSLILAKTSLNKLTQFNIYKSQVEYISKMIEMMVLRIQGLVFPLMFILFIFSFMFNSQESTEPSVIDKFITIIAPLLPFIVVILIINSAINYVSKYNNKILTINEGQLADEYLKKLN